MTAGATVVTLCSTPRLEHVRRQLTTLGRRDDARSLVVWIGDDRPPELAADDVIIVPPGIHGLRLGSARNAGADRAVASGSPVVIFLDADCIPGPALVPRYTDAARRHPDAVLCGPVTYLDPGAEVMDDEALGALTRPHPARPSPADGRVVPADPAQYQLFWSLSFGLTAGAWVRGPRFDEAYEGYGGEDTDFGLQLLAAGIPLLWVGGAHAYHQYHPTSVPPWQHLDDILRNGRRFSRRWGRWPMTGWLDAFEQAGAIRRVGGDWVRR